MLMFRNIDDVEGLTDEQALAIVQLAADKLTAHLTLRSVALDDSGDYLAAAADNYHRLFHAYWDNDGDSATFVQAVKDFLFEPHDEWGGCDGDIRFDVFEEV